MENPAAQLLIPDLVELINGGSFRELREALRTLEPVDIAGLVAELIEEHTAEHAAIAYRVLPRDDAAEVFSHLSGDEQEELIGELGNERAVRVVESMSPDDRAKLLDELPVEVTRQIIRRLDAPTRRETQAILGYPAESVGRIMTPDYVKVRPGWTVASALSHLRQYGKDAETVHWVYVVEPDGALVDDVHIRQILLADPESKVDELLDGRFVALKATDDREEAVRVMARYDRTALPVVDGLGLLVGIVTYDDVADVAEIEATEDIHKLGGLEALSAPYLSVTFVEMMRKRAGWLTALFGLQIGTIAVLGAFEQQLERAVILSLFIPLIVSSGGNTGTQAASMLVRSLALGEVEPGDWVGVAVRELRTGLALGVTLGLLGFGVVLGAAALGLGDTDGHAARVGLVIGVTIAVIVVWGSLAGSLLPLLLQRIGLDPAASSSPLVATIMDISGLTIYLLVAVAVLTGVLL